MSNNVSPDICFLVERPLSGFDLHMVQEKCVRAGLSWDRIAFHSISEATNREMNALTYSMIVTMGERALTFATGKRSIWKWHLSPLDPLPEFNCRRVIPTFDTFQLKKEWHLNLYLEMALRRASAHAKPGSWERKPERYRLVGIEHGTSYDEAIHVLESIRHEPWHSLDIETGRNQINTFGIAWSASDAIAIKILPDLPTALHHKLWSLIVGICESDSAKMMQNGIYERTYCSRYGFLINNFRHDTMVAQKFLWPELEKGLDNVGRIYTMESYWKDDGRVSAEEGKQKDWGNIRDWTRHLDYNCKDTSNTLIAGLAQRKDLETRGLASLYDTYIQRLFDCTYEMGARGLPLNREKQVLLTKEYEGQSSGLTAQLSVPINPRSAKQKLKLFRDKNYALPVKRATGKESADELSLKRLRLKHPDDLDIKLLLEIAGIDKALSSYLRVKTLPDDRIRFMLDAHGTETGRMSCSKDPWGGGFNAQTLTGSVKEMIEFAPETDRIFVEFDLEQAETRFVAYDACEEMLLGMLERREDIHRHVAAEIYQKPVASITHDERQLGKKSGHGANYSMGVSTFQDSCLKEMDLILDRKMATRTLDAYHKLFPGIRRWHAKIRNTVYSERRLSNPLGRIRYFYGRTDDNTYREAYAYRPQSTVPDVANKLMLGLLNQRTENTFDFWLHLQVHDSVLISCKRNQLNLITKYAASMVWHPEIILPAGRLVIPISGKFGACLGAVEKLNLK